MTKPTTTVLMLMTALFLGSASRIEAQTTSGPDFYINATFGAQPQRRTVDAAATSTIFDETAEFNAEHRIANGPFFDIAAGQKVAPNFLVGIAFSTFGS